MGIKDVLAHPRVYQTFQEAGGFFGARVKSIAAYLPLKGDEKIIDIGCGPGFIVEHLPRTCTYVGYDPSPEYIDYANRHFGDRGDFVLGFFDADAVKEHQPADVVMLNGVLHHMTDAQAAEVAKLAADVLRPGGRLFTLDGCFVEGQNRLARRLLENDRGEYVRHRPEYEALLEPHFAKTDVFVDHGFSRIPYTFISMVGHTAS